MPGCKAAIFAQFMIKKFAHDDVVPNSSSALSKKEQVANMFDNIAYRYDFLNRFLSAGTDIIWRKKALNFLKDAKPQRILDVATGTADVAIMAAKQLKAADYRLCLIVTRDS